MTSPPLSVTQRQVCKERPAAPQTRPAHATARPPLLAHLACGAPIPGRVLAERLGVSRAAVWKQIENLRSCGLAVPARSGGYTLEAPLDLLDAEQIRSGIDIDRQMLVADLAVHWRVDSTNSELIRRAVHDPRDRLACVAEIQSRGRGRRGRDWQMPLGGGVALSLLKRFDGAIASLAGLSLVAGVATVQALADCGIDGVDLKWPNDLVAHGAKLGGILIELGGDSLGPCHAVIGIGINVHIAAAGGAAINQPWIDLATLSAGQPPARNHVVARLLARLIDALDRFADAGFPVFADAYAHHDVLRGRHVCVLRAGAMRQGIARGVDERGALRVAFEEGERSVDSGEVSVRVAPAP